MFSEADMQAKEAARTSRHDGTVDPETKTAGELRFSPTNVVTEADESLRLAVATEDKEAAPEAMPSKQRVGSPAIAPGAVMVAATGLAVPGTVSAAGMVQKGTAVDRKLLQNFQKQEELSLAGPSHLAFQQNRAGVDKQKSLTQMPGSTTVTSAKTDDAAMAHKKESPMPEQAPPKDEDSGAGTAPTIPEVEFVMDEPGSNVLNGSDDQGLAVAMPVKEHEDDGYIPSAVEYDPSAKPPLFRRRRFRLYALLGLFALVAAAIGAVIGVLMHNNGDSVPMEDEDAVPVPYRETLGIRERVERLVGEDKLLDDPTDAYNRALTWITHNDTMQLVPESENFVQRYVAAYFYFATSVQKPWISCNPAFLIVKNTAETNASAINGTTNGIVMESHEPQELPATESCILLRLKSIAPLSFSNSSGFRWLSSQHECNWAGLECDETFRIRTIDLLGNHLNGPFPEGVQHFEVLQKAIFSWGGLYGPLPPGAITPLQHLVDFQVQFHDLTGPIPEDWFGHRQLRVFNLANNNLNGTISPRLADMEGLRGLYLQGNALSGSIPTEIGALTALSIAFLSKNQLSGPIPDQLSNMAALEKLYAQKNLLTGTLPADIGKMPMASELRMHFNLGLGGGQPLPESLFDLNLKRLDLRSCNFTGPISPRLADHMGSTLKEFRLANNAGINGQIPAEMANMTNLFWVELHGTALEGLVPADLCQDPLRSPVFHLSANCKPKIDEATGQIVEPAQVSCPCCTKCCDADGLDCVDVVPINKQQTSPP